VVRVHNTCVGYNIYLRYFGVLVDKILHELDQLDITTTAVVHSYNLVIRDVEPVQSPLTQDMYELDENENALLFVVTAKAYTTNHLIVKYPHTFKNVLSSTRSEVCTERL